MKIIEVRDGFINFEADESVYLSSFVKADGVDKCYIAQVNQIRTVGKACIAVAKILFLIEDGELRDYDKTLPSVDAEIKTFSTEFINNAENMEKPIIVGKLPDKSNNIVITSSAFDKKMLVSFETQDFGNLLINNLSKQFLNLKKNILVIDTLGVMKGEKSFAGANFKLPLDRETLNFMYQTCLNDATQDSKAIIAEVFRDLAEYSDSVPFVPFEALKSVVDDMVDNQHIFKMFVLKNKLGRYKQLGYFASTPAEVDNLKNILTSETGIVDLSKLNPLFINRYLDYIYSNLEQNPDTQVFLIVSNIVSKKSLKHIFEDSSTSTTLVSHSKYLHLNDIKTIFDNYILEFSDANKAIFKGYKSFFDSMSENMYLITGKDMNNIPLVSDSIEITDVLSYDEIQTAVEEPEVIAEVQEKTEPEEEKNDVETVQDISEESEETQQEFLTDTDIIATIEEKSEKVINAVAQELPEEPQDFDLFSDEESVETDSEIEPELEEETETETPEINEFDVQEDNEDIDVNLMEEDINLQEVNENPQKVDEVETSTELSEDNFEEEISIEPIQESQFENETYTPEEDNEPIIELQEDLPTEDSESVSEDINELSNEEIIDLGGDIEEEDNSSEIQIDENMDSDSIAVDDIQLLDNENSYEISNEESSIEDEAINYSAEQFVDDNDDDDSSFDEIVELDPSNTDENDIIIDISDEPENININEETDRQIVEDVDKVFTTMKDSDEPEEISDSDLDFIDELNNDEEDDSLIEYGEEMEELSDSNIEDDILDQPQEGIIPERQPMDNTDSDDILEKREANTPIVPVYDADIPQEDMVESDPLQQGDSVIHAKYGNGIVEKMIKYGSKTLFSINFENIGRRLLDPTLTEIKKL